MKIHALSDLHGHLPEVPDCDLLLLGGDYVHEGRDDYIGQAEYLNGPFCEWLRSINSRGIKIVGVWGNHEVVADKFPELLSYEVLGKNKDSPWTLLNNNSTKVLGYDIWGTPYSREFGTGWGFNATEDRLSQMYESVPLATDIIVSHGPPYYYGDKVEDGKRVGNKTFTDIIGDFAITLSVVGHIHEAAGHYLCGKNSIINASYVDSYCQARKL